MKNSTEIAGMGPWDKITLILSQNTFILFSLGAFLLGVCFSTGRILGVTSAFGVALAAASPRKYCLQSSLGAVFGYLLLPGGAGVFQAGAVALIAAIRFFITGSRLENKIITSGPVLAAVGMAMTGVAQFKTPVNFYDGIIFLAQAALAPASAFFIEKAFDVKSSSSVSDVIEKVSMAVTLGICLVGLMPVEIRGIALGHVVGLFTILIAAYCGGIGAGTIVGAVCGLVIGFVTGDFSAGIASYSLIGLISGTFAGAGRTACAAAMVLTGGFLLLTGIFTGIIPAVEIALASVAFMLMPSQLLRLISKLLSAKEPQSAALKTVMEIQLNDTVTALKDICSTTKQVSQKLENLSVGNTGDIYDEVGEKLCRRCSKKMTCWSKAYSNTADAISAGLSILRRDGHLTHSDLPMEFLARCEQPKAFAQAVEDCFNYQLTKAGMRQKVSTMRSAVTDQFEGLAMYLEGVRNQLDNVSASDNAMSLKVEEVLTSNKLEPAKAFCHKNAEGRFTVTALLPIYKLGRAQSTTITADLSKLLKREMELAGMKEWGDGVYVTFRERSEFKVTFSGCQFSCDGHNLCGDTFRQFSTTDGKAHMVLSDGMGSGGSAAVDSAMAASLTERLVQSGADYYSALRLVNSALLVKSGEESLATIDAVCADLYSGRADFYKAGAAPTIIKHNGRAASIESASIPAGILTGVNFEHTTVKLKDGDLVVMLSDGVSASGVDWIISEVLMFDSDNLDELCRKLAQAAKLRRTDGREDDITVICMRIDKFTEEKENGKTA